MAGTIVAGTLSDGTYSGSVTDTVRGACKAWVNFNGTGTVAIRAAYNVSSITDNGTSDYTVNFTTAMVDANFSAPTTSGLAGSYGGLSMPYTQGTQSASAYRFRTLNNAGSYVDMEMIYVAIFR